MNKMIRNTIMHSESLNKKQYFDINIEKLFKGCDIDTEGIYILQSKIQLHNTIDQYVKEDMNETQKINIIESVIKKSHYKYIENNVDVLCYSIINFYCVFNYLSDIDEDYDEDHAFTFGFNQANESRLHELYVCKETELMLKNR